LRKAAFDSGERKRLYKEAKTFLKVRSMRNKLVKSKSNGNGNGHGSGNGNAKDSASQPQETVQV
jgi:hypothetical protein